MRDEAMIAQKGWLIFKIYMPNKPGRYGIKAYLVSVSTSEYVCNMEGTHWQIMTSKNLGLEILGAQLQSKAYQKCRVCSAHK